MNGEEAARFIRQWEQRDPAGLWQQIESEAADNPELAELMEAARQAHREAEARGVPVAQVIAEWIGAAEPWSPKPDKA